LVAGLLTGAASAKPKIYKSVPTHVQFSATRAADGTITARVSFTSKDGRCLAAKRFKRVGTKHRYLQVLSALLFGGPFTANGEDFPAGAKGSASPRDGFSPISPFGKSPLVWEAVLPGDELLEVFNPQSDTERRYKATVAEASGLRVVAAAPVSKGQGLSYFKVAFDKGGKRIIEKCQPLAHPSFEGPAGSYVARNFVF